jgi:anti-anti-sigma factor
MTCDQYNNVCVIGVEGDLTGPEALAVRNAVERRPADSTACVIDLERCHFFGGEGIETLLLALRHCDGGGARLKLAGLDHNCRTILTITRLDHRFECCNDLSSALKEANA